MMPELPEVELLKQGLERYVLGLVVDEVRVRSKKILSGDPGKVVGGRIERIRRFGKMLSLDLSNSFSLAVHVKMTGRLIYRGRKQPKRLEIDQDLENLPGKHTHAIFVFKNGDKLYYNDMRKFGWIKILKSDEVSGLPFVSKLGPEPLGDFSSQEFFEITSKYSRPIKNLIMDQKRISGVGNIYANEALFCAGIKPERKSNKLDEDQARKLISCIKKVLKQGMEHGGSSTDSFRDVLGQKGEYQEHYLVYNREGEECRRRGCQGRIKKEKLAGRGTYFCPKCQI